MRFLNLQNTMLMSLLVAGVAAAGCSSGSDAPNTTGGAGGSSTGASGSTGTAGQTSGTAGASMAGAGGSSTGTAGTNGASGAGGGGNDTGVCAGAGTRPPSMVAAKVDDFEGAMISPGWSSFNDVTPTANSFMITQTAGGALGTGHAGHYMGTGAKTTAKGGYGVGTVYNVAIDKAMSIYCIDISAFDGVTFWAKAATAGSKVNVNFVLPETNAKKDGGDCVGTGADMTVGCYNPPYKTVTLTADWAQYSVAFADAGMGTVPGGGVAKVANKIQELLWITLDMDWDFSLDEVQFYKGTPPTGPAGGGDAGK